MVYYYILTKKKNLHFHKFEWHREKPRHRYPQLLVRHSLSKYSDALTLLYLQLV